MADPSITIDDVKRIIDLKLYQENQLFTNLLNKKTILWKKFYIRYFYNYQEYEDLNLINDYLIKNKLLTTPPLVVPVYIAWSSDLKTNIILKLGTCSLVKETNHYIIYLHYISPYYAEQNYKSDIIIIE